MTRAKGVWIAVVGPIGVGKSTLAQLLAQRTGARFVPERFEENAFLERFYKPGGIERWGLHTETAFLVQRYDQVRSLEKLLREGVSVVTDFTPQQNLLFARITVDALEFELYQGLYERLLGPLPSPDRLVCLDADLRVILQRIRRRGRAVEASLERRYLERLRKGYAGWRESPPAPATWIDTSRMPIPTDLVARADALEAVMRSLEPEAQEALFGRSAAPRAASGAR